MTSGHKIALLSASIAFLFVFTSVDIENTGGAPACKTGSPGDNSSCTSCHAGTATVLSGAITSDIPASGYIPGNVYTISGTISDPVKNKFGFQISPQKINGAQVGTMTITDATRTQLTGLGKYVTHKSAGTAGTSNSNTWSFQWTAPGAGTGSFTFYGAFLIANSNNTSAGDVVKLSTLAVAEDTSNTSLHETKLNEILVFPNPASEFIECRLERDSDCLLRIYSVKGEIVAEKKFSAQEKLKMDISAFSAGTYILQVNTGNKKLTRKFIKE